MKFPRRRILPLLLLTFVVWKLWPSKPLEAVRTVGGSSMGTTWSLRSEQPEQYRETVAGVFTKWEQHLTHWNPGGDVAKMNAGAPPTPALAEILGLARKLEQETGGYFSPTPDGETYDLSAIGKGYAIDRAAAALEKAGLRKFVLELGGEVYAAGRWQVALPGRVVTLENEAVATSGNVHQDHIVDPHTGKNVARRPATCVSVITPDCATADAWATALFAGGAAPPGQRVFWQGDRGG
jgi:thiamine biosynthesis lipoprotein